MWNCTTAVIILFLLLAHLYRPSLSDNEDSGPNSNGDCSWGSCDENQENPSNENETEEETETLLEHDPGTASNQEASLSEDSPASPSSEALGPELDEQCSWGSCPGLQVDTFEQDFAECDEDEHTNLQERTPGTLSPFTDFFPKISKLVSDGAKAAFNTVHRLSADVLEDIASIVRTVFSEEAYNFVSSLSQGAINSLFSPGMSVCLS